VVPCIGGADRIAIHRVHFRCFKESDGSDAENICPIAGEVYLESFAPGSSTSKHEGRATTVAAPQVLLSIVQTAPPPHPSTNIARFCQPSRQSPFLRNFIAPALAKNTKGRLFLLWGVIEIAHYGSFGANADRTGRGPAAPRRRCDIEGVSRKL